MISVHLNDSLRETDHDIDYNGVLVLASDSYKFRLQIKVFFK